MGCVMLMQHLNSVIHSEGVVETVEPTPRCHVAPNIGVKWMLMHLCTNHSQQIIYSREHELGVSVPQWSIRAPPHTSFSSPRFYRHRGSGRWGGGGGGGKWCVELYCLVIQCPWWVYPDFIDDNCEGQPLGTKTWRQYEEEEDGMEEFLDTILHHANNSRQRDDSLSLAISHPVAWLLDGEHQYLPGDYPLWHVECQVGCSKRLQGGYTLIFDFGMARKRMSCSPYFNWHVQNMDYMLPLCVVWSGAISI